MSTLMDGSFYMIVCSEEVMFAWSVKCVHKLKVMDDS